MKDLLNEVDVVIGDCVLRDGFQILSETIPTDNKKAILELLVKAGVHTAEVTSMVPPHVLPQFGDAEELIEHAIQKGMRYPTVLAPNAKGARRAIAAGAPAIVLPLSVSETHSQKNLRKSRSAQVAELAEIRRIIDSKPAEQRPLLAAGVSTAFGCSYEGKISEADLFSLVDQCLSVGIDEVSLADTVGYASPNEVGRVFKQLVNRVDDAVFVRAHFHDTYGLGLANVYAALDAGVRVFDGSLAGLGGCPFAPNATGNTTLEDIVFLMQKCGLKTGINLDILLEGQQMLHKLVPEQPLYGVINRAGKYPTGFTPDTR